MTAPQPFPGVMLDRCGLNRQAIFDLDALPDDIFGQRSVQTAGYRQLILIGHGGTALWQAVGKSGITGRDPIDDFTLRAVRQWMAEELPGHHYAIVYPDAQAIPLQRPAHWPVGTNRHRSCSASTPTGNLVRLPRCRSGRHAFCSHFSGRPQRSWMRLGGRQSMRHLRLPALRRCLSRLGDG